MSLTALTNLNNPHVLHMTVQVSIAAQVYDFIDKHIQCLDVDLRALGDEIENSKEALGLGFAETGCGRLGIDLKRNQVTGKKHGRGAEAGVDGKRKKGKKQEGAEEENLINLGECLASCQCCCCCCSWQAVEMDLIAVNFLAFLIMLEIEFTCLLIVCCVLESHFQRQASQGVPFN